MTEPKSKCPFAMFNAFGQRMANIGHPTSRPTAGQESSAATALAPAATDSGNHGTASLEDEALAYRTLLMHASVVRGHKGNLLVLPSISLPTGDLKDAPAAIRAWLGKVKSTR